MSVNNRLGVNLPIMGLADSPTVVELVDKIIALEQPQSTDSGEVSEAVGEETPAMRAGSGD
jgi:hypothetical protein